MPDAAISRQGKEPGPYWPGSVPFLRRAQGWGHGVVDVMHCMSLPVVHACQAINADQQRRTTRHDNDGSGAPDALRRPQVVRQLWLGHSIHDRQRYVPVACRQRAARVVRDVPGDVHHAEVAVEQVQQQQRQRLHLQPVDASTGMCTQRAPASSLYACPGVMGPGQAAVAAGSVTAALCSAGHTHAQDTRPPAMTTHVRSVVWYQ
jgi:hypothetical protein